VCGIHLLRISACLLHPVTDMCNGCCKHKPQSTGVVIQAIRLTGMDRPPWNPIATHAQPMRLKLCAAVHLATWCIEWMLVCWIHQLCHQSYTAYGAFASSWHLVSVEGVREGRRLSDPSNVHSLGLSPASSVAMNQFHKDQLSCPCLWAQHSNLLEMGAIDTFCTFVIFASVISLLG
jgi:hypothetical protein